MASPIKVGRAEKSTDKANEELECPVCIQRCVHPVKLPCGHIFCYLCVKGVTLRNRNCALCRQPIPTSFLNEPDLLDKSELEPVADEVRWFYQGRNHGWWQYEHRMGNEIEKRYEANNKDIFDIQIAGYLYTVDFTCMEQYRKDDRGVSRSIKRDLIKYVDGVKGTAGIQLNTIDGLTRTVEGGSTADECPNPTPSNGSRRNNPTRHTNQQGSDSSAAHSGRTASAGDGLRHRGNTRQARQQSPPTVDITRLVADMNLADNINSSDDEQATAV